MFLIDSPVTFFCKQMKQKQLNPQGGSLTGLFTAIANDPTGEYFDYAKKTYQKLPKNLIEPITYGSIMNVSVLFF